MYLKLVEEAAWCRWGWGPWRCLRAEAGAREEEKYKSSLEEEEGKRKLLAGRRRRIQSGWRKKAAKKRRQHSPTLHFRLRFSAGSRFSIRRGRRGRKEEVVDENGCFLIRGKGGAT